MRVINTGIGIAVALLLVACATDDEHERDALDCVKTFCGCSSPATKSVRLRLSDADRSPIANAGLICHDDGSFLGTTNNDGLLTLEVAGEDSPGCGFMPDCQVAYIRTESEKFGRHFWFARFVRGEDVSARAHAVEMIKRDN